MTSPIVSTEWLANRLLDPTIKVIEVSSKLGDEAPYETNHIPGALNFYWKDLCWHNSDREFVTPGELANRLGKVGISDTHALVLILEGEVTSEEIINFTSLLKKDIKDRYGINLQIEPTIF